MDEALAIKRQRFVRPEAEDAYKSWLLSRSGATSRVISFSVLYVVVVCAAWIGQITRNWVTHCADKALMVFFASLLAGILAYTFLALAMRERLVALQIALFCYTTLVCSVGMFAPTLYCRNACNRPYPPFVGASSSSSPSPSPSLSAGFPFQLSSSSSGSKPIDYLAIYPPFLPVILAALTKVVFVSGTAAPWPLVAYLIPVAVVIEEAGFAVYIPYHGNFGFMLWYILLFFLDGLLAVFIGVGINSTHRKQFAALVVLERERRQAAVEKGVTDTLIEALFPKAIADQLRSRASSISGVRVAQKHREATVVSVAVAGIDTDDLATRLELLSNVFVAADKVAEVHSAEKIKSTGETLLFVCGVPTERETHARDACEFAVALQQIVPALRCETNAKLVLHIGIATGPVVAGVIGSLKPHYDVWGYTVLVAQKLMGAAPAGAILTTKDVAKRNRHFFKFQLVQQLTKVRSMGSIISFVLQPPSSTSADSVRPAIAQEHFRVRRHTVDIASILRSGVPADNAVPLHLVPYFLCFRNLETELQFLQYNVAGSRAATRWTMFATGLVLAIHLVVGLATRETLVRSVTFSVHLAVVLLMWLCAAVASAPFLKKRWALYYAAVTATILGFLAADAVMWDLFLWKDSMLGGFLVSVIAVHMSRQPFVISSVLSLMALLATAPIYITIGYSCSTLVLAVTWVVVSQYMHSMTEWHNRSLFVATNLIKQSRDAAERDRKDGDILLRSVLPQQIIDRLVEQDVAEKSIDESTSPLHLQPQQPQSHLFAELVPSATVLVVSVVGFESLFKKHPPEHVVRLLDSLFSHFDGLTAACGLEPLTTNGAQYIVVGNVLQDKPDHAKAVIKLARDIASSMAEFNARTKLPVQIRIGVHTDRVVTGVIRMKALQFDCWGDVVPVAEHVCEMAPSNCVLVSGSTLRQTGSEFENDVKPFKMLKLAWYEVKTFVLETAFRPPSPGTDTTEQMWSTEGWGGDYGVYCGNPSDLLNLSMTTRGSGNEPKVAAGVAFAQEPSVDLTGFDPVFEGMATTLTTGSPPMCVVDTAKTGSKSTGGITVVSTAAVEMEGTDAVAGGAARAAPASLTSPGTEALGSEAAVDMTGFDPVEEGDECDRNYIV